MPMDEEPPRTLRQSPADQQDPESENRPDRERQPPSDVLREQRSVEERQRGEPADRRSDPVAAVDREVDAATVPGGDQLIDCRVDRRVLAADPHAGQEPEQEEVPRRKRKGGRHGGHEIHVERQHEQFLAAEAIGQLSEHQRTDARARDVDRTGGADARRAHVEPAAPLGQTGGDGSDSRDLEAVQHPHCPQPDHDAPVEARPRQSVKPSWDAGADRPKSRAAAVRPGLLIRKGGGHRTATRPIRLPGQPGCARE